MLNDKQEIMVVWDLLRQMEKVTSLLWQRYLDEFLELDRAEIERRLSIENDSITDEPYPF